MTIKQFAVDPIAERILEFVPAGEQAARRAIVRLGRPIFIPPEGEKSGYWAAPFEIAIDSMAPVTRHAYGEDGVQALQLAMSLVGATLKYRFDGEFRLYGSADLGFPIAGETEAPDQAVAGDDP